jgi:ubiquinone/menaquinone biosynthesis C-methylase UbiE
MIRIALLAALLVPAPPPQQPDVRAPHRQPAPVMGVGGAPWLVRTEREEEEHPEELLDALRIRSGDVVADVGAGVGYFSIRLAGRVGKSGRVLAVDIQQEMLDLLALNRKEAGIDNIELILGTPTDPRLPVNGVDLVLMVDVYHEFSHPAEMMEKIRASLRSTGRVVFVEYRGEDPTVPIKPLHKMTEKQVLDEIVPMGFRHIETLRMLPRQHIIVFGKQLL